MDVRMAFAAVWAMQVLLADEGCVAFHIFITAHLS